MTYGVQLKYGLWVTAVKWTNEKGREIIWKAIGY